MAGGLLQIVTYGSQDLYLTGTPEITFFKVVYRRYTNFSSESVIVNFDDLVGFGRTSNVDLPKIGDLIHKIYLQVTIPQITLTRNAPGSLVNTQLTISKSNYQIVLQFMAVNIQAYRLGIDQYNSVNSTATDVVNAVLSTFTNDTSTIKQKFSAILNGTGFNYKYISMADIVTDTFLQTSTTVNPSTTKQDVYNALNFSLQQSISVQNFFYNSVQTLTAQVADTTNKNAQTAWVKKLGHAIISSVELRIGGIVIDKQYGDWLNIWHELTGNNYLESVYDKMIGNVSELTTPSRSTKPSYTMWIPLQFWFCRHNGLTLPLVAIEYDVTLSVSFAKFNECFYIDELTTTQAADPVLRSKTIKQLGISPLTNIIRSNNDLTASLAIDYIYLDSAERKKFAQSSHEYLIEELQMEEITNSTQQTVEFDVDFDHPCKEFVWVAQNNKYVNYTDGFTELKWYNYSDVLNLDTINPIRYSTMDFNSHNRVQRFVSGYYNFVQPYQCHKRSPAAGINVYSFSISPEEFQPSGTANMSRITRCLLTLEFDQSLILSGNTYNIRVYTTNYNILRVVGGFAAVAYTNG
jgi:hypothetical protein